MIRVDIFFAEGRRIIFIPERYCYPRYLHFLADITPGCLFVTCDKYGCSQFLPLEK